MKVDLVVALGGGDDRKFYAAEMVHAPLNQASFILFTGEPNVMDLYRKYGVQGVGIVPQRVSKDTPDDIRVIQETIAPLRLRSMVIVDSDYHLPRTKMLYARIMKYGIQVTWIGVHSPTTWKQIVVEKLAYIREFFTVWS